MIKATQPGAQLVLAGFSGGGSFALHAAASPLKRSFVRLVLISPQLGLRAPTAKSSAWAKPFIPRIIALMILDHPYAFSSGRRPKLTRTIGRASSRRSARVS